VAEPACVSPRGPDEGACSQERRRRHALDPLRARSRGRSMRTPRRPTSSTLRRSKGCGRSFVTTALRSTGR
jgi:hypothetical protein